MGKAFKTGNLILLCLLLTFILAAIGTVLVRGLPDLPATFKAPPTLFAARLSLVTSLASTALCLVVAAPVAYALARYRLPGKGLLASALRIPLTLPPIVSGVCLLLLFGTTGFGEALTRLGLRFVFSVPGIIIAQFFVNVPSLLTVLKAAIEAVDVRLEYVARTLGCSPAKAFTGVTLPLVKNGLVAGIILTWSKAMGEFGAVLMLAGATRFKTETLPISLYLNMSTGDLEAVMAVATLLILLSLTSLTIFERLGARLGQPATGEANKA
ncbi:MAG: ABC transporter permease subunit [Clostridia bacterium]|nr:ABC transporter permease subunit [Clostridia bacterium]